MTEEKQQPIIKNWNNGSTVSVWENKKGEGDVYYSVSILHKYKRGEEDIKETIHIFPDDLLMLAELCRVTYNDLWAYRYKNKVKNNEPKEDSPTNDDIPWS